MSLDHALRARTTSLLQSTDLDHAETITDLVPLIYDELRAMAHWQLAREGLEPTLQTTELVHEAYLRLVDDRHVTRRGRAYFFAAAAHAMRRVLVDRARRRSAYKRTGGGATLALDESSIAVDAFAEELLDLDAALERLAALDARQARVVECRYFGGLDVAETADALGVSSRTVKADWALARAWLFDVLRDRGTA